MSFEGLESRDSKSSGLSRRTHKTITEVRDARFGLDSRAALRAFRLIGGFDGIEFEELRKVIGTVSDGRVRGILLTQIAELFDKYDADANGVLDVLEFENMMHSSTLLQQALYDLLERAEEEERNEYMGFAEEDMQANSRLWTFVDLFSFFSTVVYLALIAIQFDISPGWFGWHYVELAFLILFSIEIFLRGSFEIYYLYQMKSVSTLIFFLTPMLLFEVAITLVGWIELIIIFSFDGSPGVVTALRWVRIIRMARCVRLLRVFWYWKELRLVIAGILSGMKTALSGISLILTLVLLWAIIIRTVVENDWASDDEGIVHAFHSTIPDSMLAVFRCMALRADGACQEKPKLGWVFNFFWMLSETLILVGILNVVASIYVVQASENGKEIQQSINYFTFREDNLRLHQLDKLLRTLIHPVREQSNPKDRNAVEVAVMIRTEHPEVAARLPNLEMQIVQFAQHIQDARKLHQSAMDVYEKQEVTACKELRSIPNAKMYMVNGAETLLVDDELAHNSLDLPTAPVGAPQVMFVQDQDDIMVLLEEAYSVQRSMKHMVYPNSTWAETSAAGSSGDIWKVSKGLCDEAIDPGVKSLERIEQKVGMKYGGRYERNRDYSRLSLIYNSVQHLIQAIPQFLTFRLEGDGFQVVSLENRFLDVHPLGWRDVTMLVKVSVGRHGEMIRLRGSGRSLESFDDYEDDGDRSYHIMELQLRLRRFAEISHEGHRFYEEIRAHLPEDLVSKILDRLVTDTTLDLGITKAEWLQCLPNKEVKKLLDDLGIPRRARKSLYDVIDIDGSGTVTASELQEMLLLVKDPVHAHEIAGCHSRVRDIQRLLQQRIEPQLAMMSNFCWKSMEENAILFEDLFLKLRSLLPSSDSDNAEESRLRNLAVGKAISLEENGQIQKSRKTLIRSGSRATLGLKGDGRARVASGDGSLSQGMQDFQGSQSPGLPSFTMSSFNSVKSQCLQSVSCRDFQNAAFRRANSSIDKSNGLQSFSLRDYRDTPLRRTHTMDVVPEETPLKRPSDGLLAGAGSHESGSSNFVQTPRCPATPIATPSDGGTPRVLKSFASPATSPRT